MNGGIRIAAMRAAVVGVSLLTICLLYMIPMRQWLAVLLAASWGALTPFAHEFASNYAKEVRREGQRVKVVA